MKHLLISISCLLLLSCGNSSNNNSQEKAKVAPVNLSEKVFKIAEVLPLKKDSSLAFFSSLFSPEDSVKVTVDGSFKYFTGKTFALNFSNEDSIIERVEMLPVNGDSLNIPLKELAVKMDSAWKEWNLEFAEIKEPPHGLMAWYIDKQQRKKKISVMGPLIFDLERYDLIRSISVEANHFYY